MNEKSSQSKENSPWLAVCMSLFVYPGAGQFVNKQSTKGVIFGVAFTVPFAMFLCSMFSALYTFYNGITDIGSGSGEIPNISSTLQRALMPGLVATFIYLASAFDAYIQKSQQNNTKQPSLEAFIAQDPSLFVANPKKAKALKENINQDTTSQDNSESPKNDI